MGAKTTNAKARNGQTTGVKGMVKEIEKTQLKQPTVQKAKPRSLHQVGAKRDNFGPPDDGEEPEYAPPRPVDLPYESDLLPKEGLSMEGFKKENLFRGYYEHFINPVDGNGVSRRDKQFNDEMKKVMEMAVQKNEKDLEDLDWNISDARESGKLIKQKPDPPEVAEAKMATKTRGNPGQRQASTIRARKAASALSAPGEAQKKPVARQAVSAAPSRRPLSTLIAGQRATKAGQQAAKTPSTNNSTAEVASRTTLGYSRGKSASGMVHSRAQSQPTLPGRTTKTPIPRDDEIDLTMTPARARRAGLDGSHAQAGEARPHFASIFDQDGDDEDLGPLAGPAMAEEDEEEDFEIKLEI